MSGVSNRVEYWGGDWSLECSIGWDEAETARGVCYRRWAAHDSVSSSPMDSVKKKLDPGAGLDQSSSYVLSY